jgi:hypothetical protein
MCDLDEGQRCVELWKVLMIIEGSVGGYVSRLLTMVLKRSWTMSKTVREICARLRLLSDVVLTMVLNLGQVRRVLTKI